MTDWFREKATELGVDAYMTAQGVNEGGVAKRIEAALREADARGEDRGYKRSLEELIVHLEEIHTLEKRVTELQAKCAKEYARGRKDGLLEAADAFQVNKNDAESWYGFIERVANAIRQKAEAI